MSENKIQRKIYIRRSLLHVCFKGGLYAAFQPSGDGKCTPAPTAAVQGEELMVDDAPKGTEAVTIHTAEGPEEWQRCEWLEKPSR